MAQFDIHRLSDGMHVVVLQSDLIDLRESCLVAPMFRKGARAELGRLTPLITHDDKSWLVRVPQLTAMCGAASRTGQKRKPNGTGCHR